MELNSLYEYLYDLGIMLQTENSIMRVSDNGFRPWPHVFKSNGRSRRFYEKVDLNIGDDLQRLNNFKNREDSEKYCGLLRQVGDHRKSGVYNEKLPGSNGRKVGK